VRCSSFSIPRAISSAFVVSTESNGGGEEGGVALKGRMDGGKLTERDGEGDLER
jgi:hypothetical protein